MKLRSGNREMEAMWCGVNCLDLFTHAVVALSWADSLLAIKSASTYPVASGSCYFPKLMHSYLLSSHMDQEHFNKNASIFSPCIYNMKLLQVTDGRFNAAQIGLAPPLKRLVPKLPTNSSTSIRHGAGILAHYTSLNPTVALIHRCLDWQQTRRWQTL